MIRRDVKEAMDGREGVRNAGCGREREASSRRTQDKEEEEF